LDKILNFLGFSGQLFAGKTVVITGAGRGIGFEIAKLFGLAGANIIAHSGRQGTRHRLENIVNHAIEADFAKPGRAERFAQQDKVKTQDIGAQLPYPCDASTQRFHYGTSDRN
jgi:NAD(P)-dependent dehydrogenase (short-subunit alcohol dehydrogenase family)